MKKFEVIIPKQVSFTELHIHTIEAESEEEAIALAKQGKGDVEYDDVGNYEVVDEYDSEIEVIEIRNMEAV